MARLAFVLPSMAGGGAERVALALMHDFVKRGHEVDLVLASASGELLPLLPPQVQLFDLGARRLRSALWPLVGYLRQRRPHAVQVSMWPLTVIAIVAAKLARAPSRVVVSDHVALSQHYRNDRRALAMLRATTRLIYPLAAARICVSGGVADDLASLSGLRRDQFDVVYNPIDPPAAIAPTAEVERQWGEGRRILTVGSLKEQKNHLLLLDAFARLPDKKSRLMIVGEGSLRPLIESRAAQLNVADRTIMPGFTTDPWPYYASADLFVLSSDYEGFPVVLVEAMYAGLPIVSTDCPSGPAEMLDGGRYGDLVPCGDAPALAAAIEKALAKPADPARIRDRAVAMTGPQTIARYLELLLGGRG